MKKINSVPVRPSAGSEVIQPLQLHSAELVLLVAKLCRNKVGGAGAVQGRMSVCEAGWLSPAWYSRVFATQEKLEQQLGPFLLLFSSSVRGVFEKLIAGHEQMLSEGKGRELHVGKRCAWETTGL